MHRVSRTLGLAGVLVALVLAGGCAGGDGGADGGQQPKPSLATPASGFPTPDSATVQGRLLAVGGPAPGNPRPMKRGTITLLGADGSRIRGQVDAEGRYTVGVSPGSYRISGRSKDYLSGSADCLPEKPRVQLDKGTTTTVDVYCSMR